MTQVGAAGGGAVGTSVGADLRTRRLRLGLSAAELADSLGVHRTSVLRWERGDRLPGPSTVHGLARTLGCDVAAVAAFFDARRPAAPASERVRATGLRALRARHGAPADDVARALGVPPSTVYNWEQGRAGIPLALLEPLAGWAELESAVLVQVLAQPRPVVTGQRRSALSRARRRRGWSQERLAHEVGVSRGLVGEWERGQRQPELFRLRLLARALDQPVSRIAADFGVPAPAVLEARSWSPGDLPEVLRILRSWSGLRQRDVAERCGCSVEAVRGWERGRSTPRPRLQATLEQLYRLPSASLASAAPAAPPACGHGCVGPARNGERCPRHRRGR